MHTYIILQNPGHNRVYFNAARTLASYELTLATRQMHTPVTQIREEIIGGVPYLAFNTTAPLNADDLVHLSRLSFTYAIFEKGTGSDVGSEVGSSAGNNPGNEHSNAALMPPSTPLLTPLLTDGAYFINGDISAMLKYTGKTNELFTRMMLTMATVMSAHATDAGETRCVLDPVCGKGTTLFACMALGYGAYGVEIDDKIAYEAYVFLKKYLETARYKHATHVEKTGGIDDDNKKFTATRYRVELAKNKADSQLPVEIVAGDTRHMNTYYKKGMFHAIVGDLPYGVQHGSDKNSKQGKNKGGSRNNTRNITRNAMGMLADALPAWLKVLKRGGAVVLAWNVFLIPRHEMEALFVSHGLKLPDDPLFSHLSHRVDQAIERDVIVGILP